MSVMRAVDMRIEDLERRVCELEENLARVLATNNSPSNVKLTPADVLEMRALYQSSFTGGPKHSMASIAARYNVHYSTARRAILGIGWGEV